MRDSQQLPTGIPLTCGAVPLPSHLSQSLSHVLQWSQSPLKVPGIPRCDPVSPPSCSSTSAHASPFGHWPFWAAFVMLVAAGLLLPTQPFPKHNSSQLQFFVLSWFSIVPCRRRPIPASSPCKGCATPHLLQCSHHRVMLCCHCCMWEGYMAWVIVVGWTCGLPVVMVVCGKCL